VNVFTFVYELIEDKKRWRRNKTKTQAQKITNKKKTTK